MKFLVYKTSNSIKPFVSYFNSLQELCDLAEHFKHDIIIHKRNNWEKEMGFEDVDFSLEVYDDWRE